MGRTYVFYVTAFAGEIESSPASTSLLIEGQNEEDPWTDDGSENNNGEDGQNNNMETGTTEIMETTATMVITETTAITEQRWQQ